MWRLIYSVAALSSCGGRDCGKSLNSWRGGRSCWITVAGKSLAYPSFVLKSQYDAMGYYGSSLLLEPL